MKSSTRYSLSERYLVRAEAVIPSGSQTYSKSRLMYPFGASPYFVTHGKGSRVWDLDGNEYIDFVCGLAAVNLGYSDADINSAVMNQLGNGTVFSLSHPLETEVAEMLVDLIPCAEMVRFAKNGSDVTTAAIRLARAHTGKDHVVTCGYHGWHDWYIGATENSLGVPPITRSLTHTVPFNDLDALKQILDKFSDALAAVIIEPMRFDVPLPGYLEAIRELTLSSGTVLIFDELVTGFRCAIGGAQELYNVTPDLATFGKSMSNGFPISALVGRADLMRLLNKSFFSVTHGGDTLSLAAAKATIDKTQSHRVIQKIHGLGLLLQSGVIRLVEKHGVDHILTITGHASLTQLRFKKVPNATEQQLKSLLLQEMFARGILMIGMHFVGYSHSTEDVNQLLKAYDEVFPLLRQSVESGTVLQHLRCEPPPPFFNR